jgi:hypothetical protein
VKERTRHHGRLSGIPLPFGRQASAGPGVPKRLARTKGEAPLSPTTSEVASICFQDSAATGTVERIQKTVPTDCILALVLAIHFLCDAASSTVLELFTQRLMAPLWHRVRERPPASNAKSCGRIRSLKQWLSSPCRIERNHRPYRSIQISHNPPPSIPSLSTHSSL